MDHSALQHILVKQDVKPRLIRWILLLQEFDLEIQDKKGAENLVADHLSHLDNPEVEARNEDTFNDTFPNEQLYAIEISNSP